MPTSADGGATLPSGILMHPSGASGGGAPPNRMRAPVSVYLTGPSPVAI